MKQPNYLKQISEMQGRGELPSTPDAVSHVTVSHDDWCMVWNGAQCNCEPTIQEGQPKPNRAERRAKRRHL